MRNHRGTAAGAAQVPACVRVPPGRDVARAVLVMRPVLSSLLPPKPPRGRPRLPGFRFRVAAPDSARRGAAARTENRRFTPSANSSVFRCPSKPRRSAWPAGPMKQDPRPRCDLRSESPEAGRRSLLSGAAPYSRTVFSTDPAASGPSPQGPSHSPARFLVRPTFALTRFRPGRVGPQRPGSRPRATGPGRSPQARDTAAVAQ